MEAAKKISNNQQKDNEIKDRYIELTKRRDEFQKKAMEMYQVRKQVNDDRPESLVMREVYLDFYSNTLKN
jgi:hypothetical protein